MPCRFYIKLVTDNKFIVLGIAYCLQAFDNVYIDKCKKIQDIYKDPATWEACTEAVSQLICRYDVVNTLDEVFQAPHTVKLVMCTEANLQETYCGNQYALFICFYLQCLTTSMMMKIH